MDGHAFRWTAPDGSSVRAEYLANGYGNAAYVFSEPGCFASRMAELGRRLRPSFGADPVLAMYGTDHSAPVSSLVTLVAGLDPASVDVRISTLAEYLGARDAADPALPVVRGELRSHAAANILLGVLSVRRSSSRRWPGWSGSWSATPSRSPRCSRPSGRSGSWTWRGGG
ncbi:hypothetical protein AB0F91_19400 [Amycolatopsis sp. NPDC023774]|uniref:hypothetical protein n=1 Tax=Amycolatopsis sp. NPDC023774 TaxID=3155015 RepID=UPI0033CE1738